MKPAFIAAAALAIAPMAEAQAACAEIERINAASLKDFDDLTGAGIDDYVYTATLKLPNAAGCVIEIDLEVIYSCVWNFAAREEAERAYATQAAAMAPCLEGWDFMTLQGNSQMRTGVTMVSGVNYAGSGKFEGAEWQLSLNQYDSGSVAPYRLWIEMILY
ncbi:MAG: hypothetical protein Q8R82_15620 [Hyphomonadaceae bacterium]|nr:hypothetical protein [Hyphomonadaceae bacterium]